MAGEKQIYYVRIAFDRGDGRGYPLPAPAQEVEDIDCYRPFLHETVEAALKHTLRVTGSEDFNVLDRIYDPFDVVPPHEEPLDAGNEYICSCMIDDNGELDLGRRLYFIDRFEGEIRPLSFDEDFLITMEREYIFATWEMEDSYAPAMRY